MGDGRMITARFRSQCKSCGATIKPGATIWYDGCWAHCKSCARGLMVAADAQAEAERRAEETVRLRAREESNAHRLAILNGYEGTIAAQIDAWESELEYWQNRDGNGDDSREFTGSMIEDARARIAELSTAGRAEEADRAAEREASERKAAERIAAQLEAERGPITETVSIPGTGAAAADRYPTIYERRGRWINNVEYADDHAATAQMADYRDLAAFRGGRS